MLLTKSKVGGIAKQIVHSGFPDAGLNGLDGHGNASMKFLGRFEGKLVVIHDGAGRPLVTHRSNLRQLPSCVCTLPNIWQSKRPAQPGQLPHKAKLGDEKMSSLVHIDVVDVDTDDNGAVF